MACTKAGAGPQDGRGRGLGHLTRQVAEGVSNSSRSSPERVSIINRQKAEKTKRAWEVKIVILVWSILNSKGQWNII